jgi:hypothetical protein
VYNETQRGWAAQYGTGFYMTDKTYTEEEIEALLAERLAAETEGLKKKNEELLTEKKQVSQKLTDFEIEKQRAEEEGLKQREEFKTLYEREQEANKELRETILAKNEKERKDALSLATIELSGSLTRDTTKAGLLAEQAAKYASYQDGKVVYEIGGVEVDAAKVQEHLTKSFGFLVDGSGNTGSGASGNQGGGAVTKKFNDYTPAELKSIKDEDPAKYEALRQTR